MTNIQFWVLTATIMYAPHVEKKDAKFLGVISLICVVIELVKSYAR